MSITKELILPIWVINLLFLGLFGFFYMLKNRGYLLHDLVPILNAITLICIVNQILLSLILHVTKSE